MLPLARALDAQPQPLAPAEVVLKVDGQEVARTTVARTVPAAFSASVVGAAAATDILIPPSVAFVLFGLMTETSVGKLFLAGIIPGLITALADRPASAR